jgi:hypothetical protein
MSTAPPPWLKNPQNKDEFFEKALAYLGTIFLVVSVALLLGSYRNQRSTNQQTSFESRFFELLNFHRENVAELGIGEKTGRRVFVSMISEFRYALRVVRKACSDLKLPCNLEEQAVLAYTAFFRFIREVCT